MTQESLKVDNAHSGGIWTLIATEGDEYASGSVDQTVKIWQHNVKTPLRTLNGHLWGVVSLAYSKSLRILAVSSLDFHIRLWKRSLLGEYTLEKTLNGGPHDAWALAFNPRDENQLASTSKSGNIILWNLKTGEREAVLETESARFITSVAFSSDGLIASGSIDGGIHMFDATTHQKIRTVEGGPALAVRSLVFSPNSNLLAAASDDTKLYLFDTSTGVLKTALTGNGSWVLGVAFSGDGKLFATCGSDKKVRVFDAESHKLLKTHSKHADQVWSVAFTSWGTLASVSDDKSITFYDLKSNSNE